MMLLAQKFTDADIPMMKATFAHMFQQGMPLILPKSVADAATKKGFEEGVHFIRQQRIPV